MLQRRLEFLKIKCVLVYEHNHDLHMCKEYKNRRWLQRETYNIDQLLHIERGHIWKYSIIDSGSALHHGIYLTALREFQDYFSLCFPPPQTIDLSAFHVRYTPFVLRRICTLSHNENDLSSYTCIAFHKMTPCLEQGVSSPGKYYVSLFIFFIKQNVSDIQKCFIFMAVWDWIWVSNKFPF